MKLVSNVITSLLLFTLIGCSDDPVSTPQETRVSQPFNTEGMLGFAYDLKLKEGVSVKAEQDLTDQKKLLLKTIIEHKHADFVMTSSEFLAMHVDYYNKDNDPDEEQKNVETFINNLASEVGSEENPHEIKVSYENKLINDLSPREYEYFVDANTVAHIEKLAASQCYSASSLYELVYRNALGIDKYQQANRVMIFEPGHILPGYMEKAEDGSYRLYGIETTVDDLAIVDYGPTKDINEPIRVIKANDFMLVEIFKNELDELPQLVQAIVKSAGEQYDIPYEKLEDLIKNSNGKNVGVANPYGQSTIDTTAVTVFDKVNQSPFGFGGSSAPKKRLKRQKMKTLPPRGAHAFSAPQAFASAVSSGAIIPSSAIDQLGENSIFIRSMKYDILFKDKGSSYFMDKEEFEKTPKVARTRMMLINGQEGKLLVDIYNKFKSYLDSENGLNPRFPGDMEAEHDLFHNFLSFGEIASARNRSGTDFVSKQFVIQYLIDNKEGYTIRGDQSKLDFVQLLERSALLTCENPNTESLFEESLMGTSPYYFREGQGGYFNESELLNCPEISSILPVADESVTIRKKTLVEEKVKRFAFVFLHTNILVKIGHVQLANGIEIPYMDLQGY